MKRIKLKPSMIIAVVFIVSLLGVMGQAQAGSLVLTLHQNSLTAVPDAAGSWIYSGGRVYITATGPGISAIAYIADYAVTRRVITGGTDNQNTGMFTMTIFLMNEHPPQNCTLQGSCDFSTGNFIGSVSAASSEISSFKGATFSGNEGSSGSSGTLTITY